MSQRTISSPPSYNYDYLTQDAADNNTDLHYAFNSKIMVAAIIVLFLVMLFILMLHLYAKWFWYRSSRSIIITRPGINMASAATVQPSINTGLDAAVLAQLPTFIFKASSTDDSQAGSKHESVEAPLLECAVCLSEFQENEKGRLLPSCKHTFHTECIDMWFSSHSTCPLCRTVVFTSMAASPAEEHHHGEGQQVIPMETSSANAQSTTSHVPSNAVQFPCNVLFWGNEAQVASTQEPSSSNATPLPASRMRPLPQITIDIPPIEGGILLTISTPGRRSSRSTCGHSIDQAACSSQPLKSPGLRASLKRMLSRQSSRHAEGNELGSPK